MREQRTPWYESGNPTTVVRGGTWRGALWLAIVVLIVGLIGAGIWAVRVATAEARGAGDEHMIVNDGRNRVNSQEWFAGQYGQIKAADLKLAGAKAALDANLGRPDEAFYRTNFTGLQNRCMEMVATYNAETEKVSRGKWRDPALPFQITDSDAATDCQPSKEPAQ